MKNETNRTLRDKVLGTGLGIMTAGMLAFGVYGGIELYNRSNDNQQEVATSAPKREGCRQTVTRYERITVCKNSDGTETWNTQSHDPWIHRRTKSTTTYFPDGRITLYDWLREQEWEYGQNGVTLVDSLGNRFRVQR